MHPLKDVDGDGIDDVVVSPSDGESTRGIAYVYSARTGQLLYGVTSPSAIPGAFGEYGAAMDDLDGDGAGDFAVGTLFENAVYVFSGAKGTLIRTILSPSDRPCRFGGEVVRVPDVDCDGIADIAIGDWCDGGYGRVHLFSGLNGGYLRTLASPGEGDGTRYFGTYLAGVDDLDGDGAGDIIAGDPYRFRHGDSNQLGGAAYVFSGATGEPIHTVLTPLEHPNRFFGDQVAGVPDIDGDGRPEFAISASQHVGNGINASGEVYVYSGSSAVLLHILTSPNGQSSGRFGGDITGLSDIDGDGSGDLLIGAWGETPSNRPRRSGSAYLFSGASGAVLRSFASPMGNRVDAHFGLYIAGLRDERARAGTSYAFFAGDCASVCDPDPLGRVFIFRFCAADWDYSGGVDSRDFFVFLAAFFDSRGDFNRDGVTNSTDVFEFVAAFLGSCPE